MSKRHDPALRDLDECGCGEGTAAATPVCVDNPPGLSRIDYRVGTYSRFVASMQARMAGKAHPALAALRTRAHDDPTIALLHACAAVDDVLTFYQERIAHEAYLRTATERLSLVQQARLLGYKPKPGVAANVHLAFTVETTPGSPESAPVPASTRVQSIPGPNELPQTFETSKAIEARAAWNAIKLRTSYPQTVTTTMGQVIVNGIEVGLKPGDRVLLVDPADTTNRAVKRVKKVTPDQATQTTRIELGGVVSSPSFLLGLIASPFISGITKQTLSNTAITGVFKGKVFAQSDIHAFTLIQNWSPFKLAKSVNTPKPPPPGPELAGVFAMRRRASVFGHNAPRWANLPQVVQDKPTLIPGRLIAAADLSKAQYPDDWDNLTVQQSTPGDRSVDLDNVYSSMVPGGWLILEGDGVVRSYEIEANEELSRSDYTLSAKVTRLTLKSNEQFGTLTIRHMAAFGESDKLALARLPITDDLTGDEVILDGYYPGLVAGQPVILTGERTDLSGVQDSEVLVIKEVLVDGALEPDRLYTRLRFETALVNTYVCKTVTVNANTVLATHGESKAEVLGGGDARTDFQVFTLKQPPLTYISAQTPTGVQSSLEVRVNGVRWDEVPFLYGREEDERVYAVIHEEDGTPRVRFNGRLPTGQENVTALYRKGIGAAGLVHADQVTLLAVRPLGVRGVTNPLPSSGAADPESRDALRRNLPLAVLTMERLVSLRDYEDFARAFAGFAKAHATVTVDGEQQGIFVTVAGVAGAEVLESSTEFSNLVDAMHRFSDPNLPFAVKPYEPIFFQVEADIVVDDAYLDDAVLAGVETALRAAFSFDVQEFGQSVARSDVIAVIQNVAGVNAVDLNYFFLTTAATKTLEERLIAPVPSRGVSRNAATPAGLLLLDPRPLVIGVLP